jgi:hypothetical protein
VVNYSLLFRGPLASKVVVKTASQYRLDTEREILSHFRGKPYIRQQIDEIDEPPSLVLNFLDNNTLNLSDTKRLERADVKLIAKSVLEALKQFHEAGYVHTGTASISMFLVANLDQMSSPTTSLSTMQSIHTRGSLALALWS